MRKVATVFFCLFAMTQVMAQQTKNIMTVVGKDGKQTVYKVDDVERVFFSERTLTDLSNQWAINEHTGDIGSVVMTEGIEDYVFRMYSAETASSEADVTVTMPKALIGEEVPVGGENGASVVFAGYDGQLTGKVKVKFDKFVKNVTVSVVAESGSDDIRCEYSGAFGRTYESANTMTVGDATTTVASAFCMQPANVGEATSFAFGDVTAETPADMQNCTKALWISISAAKLNNGSFDMATDADSYTFRYIDYTTRTVYTKVTAGTVTTHSDSFGNAYVVVDATLEDGTQVSVDYLGSPVQVSSLDDMIPLAVDNKQLKYYNADGEMTLERKIGMALISVSGTETTFYLYPEDASSKYSSENRIQLKVGESLVNAGEVQLANLAKTDIFDFRFNAIQLQSNASGHNYGNEPNNGTLSISRSDDGTYDIYIEVTNNYNNPGMGYVNKGDNTKVIAHYKGTFEAY